MSKQQCKSKNWILTHAKAMQWLSQPMILLLVRLVVLRAEEKNACPLCGAQPGFPPILLLKDEQVTALANPEVSTDSTNWDPMTYKEALISS
jgi:hypothetical protein